MAQSGGEEEMEMEEEVHITQETCEPAPKIEEVEESEEMDDQELSGEDNENKMSKRRTKDAEGRDHKCSFCAKTYLSYPALYTHLKNKHAKGPDGNPIATLTVGRGRGRPKKTNFNGFPTGSMYRSHVEPTSSQFFKSLDKQGGPLFPDIGFHDIYSEMNIKKEESKEDETQSID